MISIQEQLQDPIFMETAIMLGYRKQDIQPLDYQKIIQQSASIMKGKSQKQKNYYLKKKAQAYENRRQKILKEVKLQMKRRSYSSSKKRYNFNPIVSNLLKQHQILCQKKLKYIEKVKIKKKDDNWKKINNTIDLGRTTPTFGIFQNSRMSRKSVHSSDSHRSGISRKSQSSQHKSRLLMVRQKDKQIQRYKKQQFLQRQNESRKKLQRVQYQKTNLSRKLRTRGQISSQAAREKKKQISFIQNKQIRDHIQKLNYKVIKHQYLKQKQNQQRKKSIETPLNQNRRRIRSIMMENEKQSKKSLYENRMRTAEKNKERIQIQRYHNLTFKQQKRNIKQKNVQIHKQFAARQEQDKKKRSMFYEMKSMEEAQYKRKQLQEGKKIKLMDSRIKEQINRKNKNTLQMRKQIQNQNNLRKSQNKMQQITQVQKLKKKLIKQRTQYTSQNLRYGKDQSFSYY